MSPFTPTPTSAPVVEGLAALSTPDLEALLRELRRGTLVSPLTPVALQSAGLGQCWSRLGPAVQLDTTTLVFLLESMRCERQARRPPRVDLVWTGPDVRTGATRDTAIVVRELFESARREVLVAGFSFDHGDDIFAPLHARMTEFGVTATLFLDVPRVPDATTAPWTHVDGHMRRFLSKNWPFGEPWPSLYFDPRTVEAGSIASLHAKCIVVDEERALVTSANFTSRGQTRNIEVGALISDPSFARDLAAQWRAATRSSLLQRWSGG